MIDFLEKRRIFGNNLISDTVNYMVKKYKQSVKMFSYSTAYGQIILFLNNISQYLFFYIKDSTDQTNFATANRAYTVHGLAQLSGHLASKGRSAVGEVSLGVKSGINTNLVIGSKVLITNLSRIKCETYDTNYMFEFSQDFITVDLLNLKANSFRIVEGEEESQSFIGTGEDIQSFELQLPPGKQIDEVFIKVFVNGDQYERVTSLYAASSNQKIFLLRNTPNGIAIVFGKKLSHTVPQLGNEIVCNYLITKGAAGNIDQIKGITWTFSDPGVDLNGNQIDLNKLLDITCTLNPTLGADEEDMNLTKVIAPNAYGFDILHDKNSLEYYFRKMNYFSTVKIFRDETSDVNSYKVMLLPELSKKLNSGEDYFTLDINKFILQDYEKTRLLNSIHESGKKSTSVDIHLINPKTFYFSMSVICDVFEFVNSRATNLDDLEVTIRSTLSDYLIQNKRTNKIPHSDIIRILDQITEIDSVKVVFHTEFIESYDTFGNIQLEEDSIAICRGGFVDYQGVEFFDKYDPNDNSMGSVNTSLTIVKGSNLAL